MAGRFNRRYDTVRFEDANGLGLTVGPGPGDLSMDGFSAENVDSVRVLDRGVYDGHVLTDDTEQSGSLTVTMEDATFTSAVAARVIDFLRKAGLYAAAVSTNPNLDVWSFKVILTATKGANVGVLTLPNVRATFGVAEAVEENTITINLSNNGAPTWA